MGCTSSTRSPADTILLGLIREGGEGVAAQVLVTLGADLNQVRPQVIQLLHGREPRPARPRPPEPVLLSRVETRLDGVERRLAAVERRVGTGPDTGDLDEQLELARADKQSAVDAQDYERAASLRDRENQLLASKAACQEEWTAGHPDLPSLAELCQQLCGEIERLRALLRQHGIEPEDRPA